VGYSAHRSYAPAPFGKTTGRLCVWTEARGWIKHRCGQRRRPVYGGAGTLEVFDL
jgi:hypothetical protein